MTKKVLGGGLDVGEFFEDSQSPLSRDTITPYTITGDMFQSARKNRMGFGSDNYWDDLGSKRMAGSIFGDSSDEIMGGLLDRYELENTAALGAYSDAAERKAGEVWEKYVKKAQKKKEGSGFSKAIGTVGKIAGTIGSIASVVGFLCDERLKSDISPLQVSEVDDALSQMAFAVKAIREHA